MHTKVYEELIHISIKLDSSRDALIFAERSRAKAFVDIISTNKLRVHSSMNPSQKILIDQEQKLLLELGDLQKQESRDSVKFNEKFSLIKEKINNLHKKIELFDPEYVSLRQTKKISVDSLQQFLQKNKDLVIIEYFVTLYRLYIFIIDSNNIKVVTINVIKTELDNLIDEYSILMQKYLNNPEKNRLDEERHLQLNDRLCKLLIMPISNLIYRYDRICFIPHGSIHKIPIHAINLNQDIILQTKIVTYLPTVTLLKSILIENSQSYRKCLLIGNDFLDETIDVGKIFGVSPFMNISKDVVKEIITNSSYDVIHFSCHGTFNGQDPLSSGLNMNDGLLTAREILQLKINSKLVTLSACDTGINKNKPGEELIGLTRSFLYAGASSIIVSLWPVEVEATRKLMLNFYKNLNKNLSPSRSLQMAQLELTRDINYSHPYFWAPFILIGN